MDLVVGATGSLGGRIAHALLGLGREVRALVRDPAKAGPLEAAGAQVVVGNVKDPASLDAACKGADVVVSTATMSKRGDDTPENVDQRGTQNLIDAARRAGVRKFVFVSTLNASVDSPVPVFRAKGAAEEHLRHSGMDYTIIQANAFMDVWFPMLIEMPLSTGQPVTLVGESRRRHAFVAERDVAAFAVAAALGNPAARTTTLAIGGPEAVTLREVVRAYEEALGRSIPVRSIGPGESIPGLPDQVSGFAAALESFDSPVPMEEACRVFGVSLSGLRDFTRNSPLASGT
jgi:NADH dehydrogenase